MADPVVITGVGLATAAGMDPSQVLWRVRRGESLAKPPTSFDATPFACPVCAQIADFDGAACVPEAKALRMMSRDAQLAVAAAQGAVIHAGLRVGSDYPGDQVGLFGATGLAGVPLEEVSRLVGGSAGADGRLDLVKFGGMALKQVRPVLSFKILSNMPLCFVSIFQGIQGPNAVFSPWEGQGAAAIVEGARAIARGETRCVLAGGCDVKTHELGFIALHQQGVFERWRTRGAGPIPAEGAAFLVLESADSARDRGARVLARVADWRMGTGQVEPFSAPSRIAADDTPDGLRTHAGQVWWPKPVTGNLFAAAAALQVGIGALVAAESGGAVAVDCFGHGSQQASFLLEGP